jgi:hypothetical protein
VQWWQGRYRQSPLLLVVPAKAEIRLLWFVIPAKAGIQGRFTLYRISLSNDALAVALIPAKAGMTSESNSKMDPGFRRDDEQQKRVTAERRSVKRERSLDPRLRGDDERKQQQTDPGFRRDDGQRQRASLLRDVR